MKPKLVSGRTLATQYQMKDLALTYLQPQSATLQPIVETRIMEQPTLFNLNMIDNALQSGIKIWETYNFEGELGKNIHDICK